MLKIEGLVSGYGHLEILHSVNITVEKGEIVSVLGSNGAGKSTLLRTISGIIKPWKGTITFEGKLLNNLDPIQIVKNGVVHVPEGRHIFPGLTVKENLILAGYKLRNFELSERYDSVYTMFPVLKEREKQLGGTLSGGEQQMLALARGVMPKPSLLLLDEPSLGLAPKLVTLIFKTLERFRDEGLTILLVEQNAKRALEISNRAYILATGYLALEGNSSDLIADQDVKRLYLGR